MTTNKIDYKKRRENVIEFIKTFLKYYEHYDKSDAIKQFKYCYASLYSKIKEAQQSNIQIANLHDQDVADFYWVLEILGAVNTDIIKWDITIQRLQKFKTFINDIQAKGNDYLYTLYKQTNDDQIKAWTKYLCSDILDRIDSNQEKQQKQQMQRDSISDGIILSELKLIDIEKYQRVKEIVDRLQGITNFKAMSILKYTDGKMVKMPMFNQIKDLFSVEDSSDSTKEPYGCILPELCEHIDGQSKILSSNTGIVVKVNDLVDHRITDDINEILSILGDQRVYNEDKNLCLRVVVKAIRGELRNTKLSDKFILSTFASIQKTFNNGKRSSLIYHLVDMFNSNEKNKLETFNFLNTVLKLQVSEHYIVITKYKLKQGSFMGILTGAGVPEIAVKIPINKLLAPKQISGEQRDLLVKYLEGNIKGKVSLYVVQKEQLQYINARIDYLDRIEPNVKGKSDDIVEKYRAMPIDGLVRMSIRDDMEGLQEYKRVSYSGMAYSYLMQAIDAEDNAVDDITRYNKI